MLTKTKTRTQRQIEDVAAVVGGSGCFLVVIAFLLCLLCFGPYCTAYDLNVLLDMSQGPGNHREVSMWEPAVFICGVIFSELTVPLSFLLWLLRSVGGA